MWPSLSDVDCWQAKPQTSLPTVCHIEIVPAYMMGLCWRQCEHEHVNLGLVLWWIMYQIYSPYMASENVSARYFECEFSSSSPPSVRFLLLLLTTLCGLLPSPLSVELGKDNAIAEPTFHHPPLAWLYPLGCAWQTFSPRVGSREGAIGAAAPALQINYIIFIAIRLTMGQDKLNGLSLLY